MLVLTTRIGRFVEVTCPCGHRLRVLVLDVRTRESVSLGFDAPKDITILRDSLVAKRIAVREKCKSLFTPVTESPMFATVGTWNS